MERRLTRPQGMQGGDCDARPRPPWHARPRIGRRGRWCGPVGQRGKRHCVGHRTLKTAAGASLEAPPRWKSLPATHRRGAPPPACGCARSAARRWPMVRCRRACSRCGRLGPPSALAARGRITGRGLEPLMHGISSVRRYPGRWPGAAPAFHVPAPARHRSGENMEQTPRNCKLHPGWPGSLSTVRRKKWDKS